MRSYLTGVLLSLAAACHLAGCGGSSGVTPSPIPEAQAAAVDACPTGDATEQLKAMFEAAQRTGSLDLPACTFHVTETLVITQPVAIPARGTRATVIRSSAPIGVLVQAAAAISQGWWLDLSGLRIEPEVIGQGKSALVLRSTSSTFISQVTLDRVYLGDFGGPGLLLDNSAGNPNGIFSVKVTHSWIANGVQGINVGDNIAFVGNTITDGLSKRANKSGALPGFDLTMVPGARGPFLFFNSISTSGGGIVADGTSGLKAIGNFFEYQSFYGVPFETKSAGLVQISNATSVAIRDNVFNPQTSGARFALALNNVSVSVLDSNEFSGTGVEGDIAFLGTSNRNKLAGVNVFQGETTGKISGASTGLINAN